MDYSFLSGTGLFGGIAPLEIQNLCACLGIYEKTYAKGAMIYQAGTVATDAGLVVEGAVNIVMNSYWGVSSIFGHMGKGEVFAEAYAAIPGKELLCDVVACEDSTILFLPMARAVGLCQKNCPAHLRLIQNLIRISATKNLSLSNRMMHIAPRTIRERLLSYLSEQMMANGNNRFTIPFTRQQLSEYLEVDRSALSHELSKMQQEGLLQTHKKEFVLYPGMQRRDKYKEIGIFPHPKA